MRPDRTVNRVGVVAIGGIPLSIGSPLAGRRVTLRLEAHTAHVIADGYLWRSIAFTLPPAKRARLQGARQAHHPQPDEARSSVGCRVVAASKSSVNASTSAWAHAGQTVTVEVDEHHLRVLDHNDELLTVVVRTNPAEPTRHKVYGHRPGT